MPRSAADGYTTVLSQTFTLPSNCGLIPNHGPSLSRPPTNLSKTHGSGTSGSNYQSAYLPFRRLRSLRSLSGISLPLEDLGLGAMQYLLAVLLFPFLTRTVYYREGNKDVDYIATSKPTLTLLPQPPQTLHRNEAEAKAANQPAIFLLLMRSS